MNTARPVNAMINPITKSELLNAELIRKIVSPTSRIMEIANMNPQDFF